MFVAHVVLCLTTFLTCWIYYGISTHGILVNHTVKSATEKSYHAPNKRNAKVTASAVVDQFVLLRENVSKLVTGRNAIVSSQHERCLKVLFSIRQQKRVMCLLHWSECVRWWMFCCVRYRDPEADTKTARRVYSFACSFYSQSLFDVSMILILLALSGASVISTTGEELVNDDKLDQNVRLRTAKPGFIVNCTF